jgi:hypothetical protein
MHPPEPAVVLKFGWGELKNALQGAVDVGQRTRGIGPEDPDRKHRRHGGQQGLVVQLGGEQMGRIAAECMHLGIRWARQFGFQCEVRRDGLPVTLKPQVAIFLTQCLQLSFSGLQARVHGPQCVCTSGMGVLFRVVRTHLS